MDLFSLIGSDVHGCLALFYFMEKIKKTRTPKNVDQIIAAALKLSLEVRVGLRDSLNDSIRNEVKDLQTKAEQAAKIANSTDLS